MPAVDTSPEVQVAQLGKEPAAPTHQEESSIECDFIPLIEDRREPIEDAETASDDRATAEPPTPSAQLRNPVSLATPSLAFLREEATIETDVQSNIPSPSKPTITIDRRARSMPASPTNSIASIVYTEPPTNKESVLGVDVSEAIPLDSSAKKESRSRIVLNEVIENDDDTFATDHSRSTQDKPVVEVEEEVIRDEATPASPTPSGMSSEHTLMSCTSPC
ncbi:hypothetical protein HJC23_012233 [Cyclotella cryptica]|uniref:Uncharacterized protein n=1 Tax=Cyclotella cryptica TaxID=29204 RepID=A0ABD3PM49_9STRA|eukprot:CCRYP_013164-RA/>CCRYP_013164-RA protein AED:0.48 eAED:0.48 QI:0/-1/0/1/-1/1/1/0/219